MKEESSFTIFPDELSARRKQVWESLKDKRYREAFVRQQIEVGIPFQIKAMRRAEGWSQAEFGEKLGKPQSVVSRLERPDYGRFNINTLQEIASVFDVGLLVTFVPFGTLANKAAEFSASDVEIPSYSDELTAEEPGIKPAALGSARFSDTAAGQQLQSFMEKVQIGEFREVAQVETGPGIRFAQDKASLQLMWSSTYGA